MLFDFHDVDLRITDELVAIVKGQSWVVVAGLFCMKFCED